MVSKIHLSQNINKALMYNEKKVDMGLAKCITAQNMILPSDELSLQMKKNLLNLWSTTNGNIKNNAVHFSISFHPQDRFMLNSNFPEIARQFMIMIGFEKQPYLVYRHIDTAIPHGHIVTTNIQYPSLTGIDQHYIINKKIIPANRAIEKKYNLMTTEQAREQQAIPFHLPNEYITYGTAPTKQSIDEVIHYLSHQYSFINLNEWSALLRLYHIKTIHLPENNKRTRAGLMYKLLDENMKPVGVPILASKLQTKPTLQNLSKIFIDNSEIHQAQVEKIGLELTFLAGDDLDKKSLVDNLALQSIDLVQLRHNSKSDLESIYIDHRNHCAIDERNLEQPFHLKNFLAQESIPTEQLLSLRKMRPLRNGKTIS
ncbi:MAG: relaxase/mobilization nuclease domain-containing protein [Sphingobacterium sp.]